MASQTKTVPRSSKLGRNSNSSDYPHDSPERYHADWNNKLRLFDQGVK
jgi:hypothetical protein